MALETDTRHVGPVRWRHGEIEYRLLHAALFTMFFTSTALSRLMPWRWFARGPQNAARRSVVEEARTTTNKIVPMVFMG
jgi:hypothetical protein